MVKATEGALPSPQPWCGGSSIELCHEGGAPALLENLACL